MNKLPISFCLLLLMFILQGCNGGSDRQNSVRLVNATSTSLDMSWPGILAASGVAYAKSSNNFSIGSGVTTVELAQTRATVSPVKTNFSFTGGNNYTIVGYAAYISDQPVLQQIQLLENEAAPLSGMGKIRIVDLSADAGTLDVYVSSGNSTTAPLVTHITAPRVTDYYQIAKGTYHIWIAGAGSTSDVRLDITAATIDDQQITTLVVTSTPGGVLVDGLLVNQQGSIIPAKNTSARIRIAANFNQNESVTSAVVNTVPIITSTLSSPGLGDYTLVPSGSLSISVNALPVSGVSADVLAGHDMTLLAVGSSANPSYYLLNDDNTRPASGFAKIRLVNALDTSGNLSLTYNFNQQVGSNIAVGTASATASVAVINGTKLAVDSIYSVFPITLKSQGVYSVFMLGNIAAVSGVLSLDH